MNWRICGGQKGRKVCALAASGEVSCSRATGKRLFPRAGVTAVLRVVDPPGGRWSSSLVLPRLPPEPVILEISGLGRVHCNGS